MTKKTTLEVLYFKWLFQKWVLLEVDHAQTEVESGVEVFGVLVELLLAKRLLVDGTTSNAEWRQALVVMLTGVRF